MERLREGSVSVANPFNRKQESLISLDPGDVDAFVFWTKNPRPFMKYLQEIDRRGYAYYFQFTLTPYGPDWEPGLPAKNTMAGVFRELSELIGKERVIWRYDPVIFTEAMTGGWHREAFLRLAEELSSWTDVCIFSFLDRYRKIDSTLEKMGARFPEEAFLYDWAADLAEKLSPYPLALKTCATPMDLSLTGIEKASCIDGKLVEALCGHRVIREKDRSQRKACGCVKSRDIGTYGTCRFGCRYCYA